MSKLEYKCDICGGVIGDFDDGHEVACTYDHISLKDASLDEKIAVHKSLDYERFNSRALANLQIEDHKL